MSTRRLARHPDSAALRTKIEAWLKSAIRLDKTLYRVTSSEWANRRDLVNGVGSERHGGRWNPPNSFKAVYLSCDLETAEEEYRRTNRRMGLPDSQALPKTSTAVICQMERVLDLTAPVVQGDLGVTEDLITSGSFDLDTVESTTQAIGRLAESVCFQGLLVSSAVPGDRRNVVVFNEKLTVKLSIVNEHKLPARKPKSANKAKSF
jgi:RES domain-containing protein